MGELKKGLEDVEVLETKISSIDGENGVLRYRGIDINDLIEYSFEEVTHLLLYEKLPDENELAAFSNQLRSSREIDKDIIDVLTTCDFNIEAMDALRTAVSYMSHCDPDLGDSSLEANVRKATGLIAKFPTVVATFHRVREDLETIDPDASLSHGANFLYMLKGEKPGELEAKIVDMDFLLSAEHELNASTFAARITASTLADIHSTVISGLSTLKGRLHAGARMCVMEMMDRISSPERAEDYILNLIDNKEKIMGFGHRVYKTYDPRDRIYKKLAKRLADHGDPKWFKMAEIIEATVQRELVEKREKPIYPNLDFYSAVTYKYIGIPETLATAMFAIGRVTGWVAHVLEQYADNRLIRPRAKTS
jgi:citrate synthase